MKVLGYGTKSVRGFEKQATSEEFSQHMKKLQSNKVKFMPFVQVSGKPGSKKSHDWLTMTEYRKLTKGGK